MSERWKAIGFVLLAAAGILVWRARGEPAVSPQQLRDEFTIGVWDWQTLSTNGQAGSNGETLAAAGIRRAYVDVSSYLDAHERPRAQRSDAVASYQERLGTLVRDYRANGLAVYALAGHRDWSDEELRYLPEAIMDFVRDYNEQAAPEERLAGLQFDIEPHGKPDFDQHKAKYLRDFLELAEALTKKARLIQNKDPEFEFGLVLPMWFDNEAGDLPDLSFNGFAKPVAFHVFDLLSELPNAHAAIMAYRNYSDGPDGAIAHLEGEFGYVDTRGQNLKLLVGQETIPVEPAKLTFNGLGRDALAAQLQTIQDTYGSQPSFAGFVINDQASYLNL